MECCTGQSSTAMQVVLHLISTKTVEISLITDIPQMILRYPLKSFSDHIFVLSPANTLNMLCVSTTPLRQAPATPAAPAAPAAADEDSDVELTFDEPMPRHSAGRRLHDSRL